MAESEWPGDELPPHERNRVRELVRKGWVYRYGGENRLSLTAPNGDHWRVKRDDRALPVWEKDDTAPAPSNLREQLAKLIPAHGIDLTDQTRRPGYTLAQVRSLVRQGYSAKQVVTTTGWGGYWIADLVGPDGSYRNKEMGTR